MGEEPVFFMAAHAGLGLMESAMPFLEKGAKLFLYRWNPHSPEIKNYFLKNNKEKVETFEMSLDNLIREIALEERPIVLLMTASPAYEFGAAQLILFKILQSKFPSAIVDIHKVGHCMYGCTSHAHDEACNFPVSYSRFIRKSLPYDSQSVSSKYFTSDSGGDSLKVIVCPSYSWNDTSYAKTSLLSSWSSIQVLQDYSEAKIYSMALEQKKIYSKAKICVKFHPICYSYLHLGALDPEQATQGSAHPFLSIPPQDEAGLQKMMQTLRVIPAEETSALPFLQACDVAICDLFSSMTFEALYFHPNINVLAFAGEEIPQFTPDPQIMQLVHIFHDGEELRHLLDLVASGELKPKSLPDGRNGRDFFKAKYQEPDGEEALKVGRIRRWPGHGTVPETNTEVNGSEAQEISSNDLLLEYQNKKIFPTKLEMMVTGKTLAEVNEGVVENPVRRFVEDHRAQLKAMNLPKVLWEKLFIKIHREIFDASEKFQIQFITEEDEINGEFAVVALKELEANSDLFLVDHAMTWASAEDAISALMEDEGLLQRIEALLGLNGDDVEDVEDRVNMLVDALEQKSESYSVLGAGGSQKIHFLNDEFGSKIKTAEERNLRFEVFFYVYQGIAFSVFWPQKLIEEGDEVVR